MFMLKRVFLKSDFYPFICIIDISDSDCHPFLITKINTDKFTYLFLIKTKYIKISPPHTLHLPTVK